MLAGIRHGFRKQFESGDKLAFLDCIRWCDDYGVPLPHWALMVLSQVARLYLYKTKDTLDEALFGSKVRTGRRAKLTTDRLQSRKDQLLYNTVVALKLRGFKGDRLYQRAHELLCILKVDADNWLIVGKKQKNGVLLAATIKKKYERMKQNGVRPSGLAHMIPMMVDLDDPPHRDQM